MSDSSSGAIRAAGGVVWRVRDGRVEVALVHRPRYDDWSLPKGKAEDGETELAAAVREVGEELGARVAVSRRLPRVSYRVDGRRKTVAYWAMRALAERFVPNDEVDDVAWCAVADARTRTTYDQDRQVLDAFTAVPLPDAVVLLVRHAKAGKRSKWKGPDGERPLDAEGRRQAQRLVPFLTRFAPGQVFAATPRRCVATVEPLAMALELEITVEPAFDDTAYDADAATTTGALHALARQRTVTLVSSQGVTIPGVVSDVAPWLRSTATRKGAVWVLTFADGEIVSADYYGEAAR